MCVFCLPNIFSLSECSFNPLQKHMCRFACAFFRVMESEIVSLSYVTKARQSIKCLWKYSKHATLTLLPMSGKFARHH